MRVMILGSGGVGGYVGAQLIRHTEAEVTMIARGAHLEAIRNEGLQILEDEKRSTVHPAHATDRPDDLGGFDLILVAVKSTALEESLELISKNIDENTVLLPLLNGVDHDRILHRHYPQADVLQGCIYILSNILEPGVIRKKGAIFRLCWGRPDFNPRDYAAIIELFDAAGLRHKPTEQIEFEAWKKFLFISPMAALTSLYDQPMDQIASEHGDELRTLLDELLALAQARSIPLGEREREQTLSQAAKVLPGAKTSMQLDFERGKTPELESLVGHVVREGSRLGTPTPFYGRIYEELKKRLNP